MQLLLNQYTDVLLESNSFSIITDFRLNNIVKSVDMEYITYQDKIQHLTAACAICKDAQMYKLMMNMVDVEDLKIIVSAMFKYSEGVDINFVNEHTTDRLLLSITNKLIEFKVYKHLKHLRSPRRITPAELKMEYEKIKLHPDSHFIGAKFRGESKIYQDGYYQIYE